MRNNGEILAEILKKYENCYFFLHNTKELSIAEKIMNEGLMFEKRLSHSTDIVNPSQSIEIGYFLIERKEYGYYTMVIAMSKNVFNSYKDASEYYNTGIEEIMTITDPFYGINDEMVYTISPKHILGYFDSLRSEFTKNPLWNPMFNNLNERNLSGKSFKSGITK